MKRFYMACIALIVIASFAMAQMANVASYATSAGSAASAGTATTATSATTAATATDALSLGGRLAAVYATRDLVVIPSTGVAFVTGAVAGTMVFYVNKLYVATETVAGVQSIKALW